MNRLLDALFPYIPFCVVCGAEKGVLAYLCPGCQYIMERLSAGRADAQGFDAYAPYRYENEAAAIVQQYKYGGNRWLSKFMAEMMMHSVCTAHLSFDCVCHVPLHSKKRKMRGFDQAALLAQGIAQLLQKPYVNALRRVRNTPSQTRLDIRQRRENMDGAFETCTPVNGRMLLVDDVLTTGATAAECARVLLFAGAQSVAVVTFAQAGMGEA